jgi:SSS family solute:Na+ symporter
LLTYFGAIRKAKMNIHIIPLIILIIYMLITVGIAALALRRSMSSERYLVAGRTFSTAVVLAILTGSYLGGGSVIGVTQRSYNEGIVGWLYTASLSLGAFIFAFIMAKRYRRFKLTTIPEVINSLFDTKTRIMSLVLLIVAYFFIALTGVIGGGALLSPLLGIDKWLADLITAVIFIAIIAAGGLPSVAVVNIVQVIVLSCMLLFGLVYSLTLIGDSITAGWSALFSELPPSFWSFTSIDPLTLSGEVIAVGITSLVAAATVATMFAARDEKAAFRGIFWTGIYLIPIGLVCALIGMCARIYFGDALPYGLSAGPAMMLAFPPVIAGIALCGFWAAIVSTTPIILIAMTQMMMRDIYQPFINPQASDKKILLYSRLAAVALGVLVWVIGIAMHHVIELIVIGAALRVGLAVALLIAVYLGAKYVSEDGAFWGLIVGSITLIAWTVAGSPYEIHMALPAIATSFISMLIISRFRKRKKEFSPEVMEALHPGKGEHG